MDDANIGKIEGSNDINEVIKEQAQARREAKKKGNASVLSFSHVLGHNLDCACVA